MPEKKLSVKRDSKSIQAPPKPTAKDVINEISDFVTGERDLAKENRRKVMYASPVDKSEDNFSKSKSGNKSLGAKTSVNADAYLSSVCKAKKGSFLDYYRAVDRDCNDVDKELKDLQNSHDVPTKSILGALPQGVQRAALESGQNKLSGEKQFMDFSLTLLQDSAVAKAEYDATHDAKGNELPKDKQRSLSEVEIDAVKRKAIDAAANYRPGGMLSVNSENMIASTSEMLAKAKTEGLVDQRSIDAALAAKYSPKEINAIKTGFAMVNQLGNDYAKKTDKPEVVISPTGDVVETGADMPYFFGYTAAMKNVDRNSDAAKRLYAMVGTDTATSRSNTQLMAFIYGAAQGNVLYDRAQANPDKYKTSPDGTVSPKDGSLNEEVSENELANGGSTFVSNMEGRRTEVSAVPTEEKPAITKAGEAVLSGASSASKAVQNGHTRRQIDTSNISSRQTQADVQFDD